LLLPLVYARIVVYPFVYLKLLYFQILVGLSFPAWVALALRDGRYRPKRSWLLWSIFAWFAAMGLSTAFAANSWHSFFGTQERMTGLFSLLHFLGWYTMAASVLRSTTDRRRLLDFQIGVGFVSACVVLLQLVFPGLIGSVEVLDGERLSGLFGNAIFLAAYQAFTAFCLLFLWEGASPRRRAWYLVVLAAALSSFVLAGSRGPLLGLIVGACAAVATLALCSQRRRLVVSGAITLAVVVASYAAFVLFVARRPEMAEFWTAHLNLKHFFDFEIDAIRIRLWTIAWSGFTHRPVLGWGPVGYEMASEVLYRPEYYSLHIFDEVHNRALAVLCETGLLGFVTFLAAWSACLFSLVRAIQEKAVAPLPGAALIGAAIAYFTQNLFVFDTPATQLCAFLLFAVATSVAPSIRAPRVVEESQAPARRWTVPIVALSACLAFGVMLWGSVVPLLASAYVKQASTALKLGNPAEMLALVRRAEQLPTPYREDQMLLISRAMLQLSKGQQLDSLPQGREAVALTQAIGADYLAHHPSHGRLRALYADTLLALTKTSTGAGVQHIAEAQYRRNLADSPNSQRYLVDYAKFCTETGRLEQAEKLLRQAVALHPAAGGPRWELGKFIWNQRKRPAEGAQVMAESSHGLDGFAPTNPGEWQQLAQVYAKAGRIDRLREVVQAVRAFRVTERSAEIHLAIAGYMEKSELIAERDQVLRLALERNPSLAAVVNPVLAGNAMLSDRRASNAARLLGRGATVQAISRAERAPEP
jgi:O-antigen ligase